jgi:hypothetical protein
MNLRKWQFGLLGLALSAFFAGCSGGSSSSSTPQSGNVFINGTDAPLQSVVSFQVTITGLTVTDGTNTATLIDSSNQQTVDFAKLNGLHTMLDFNTIPQGTYTSASITLANPQIAYLNVANPQTNPPTPPTISNLNSTTTPPATLTSSMVNVTFSTPLTVDPNNVIGLLFDFDLHDSIAVDQNGQITGAVTPNITLKTITPSDADAYVDEFVAGVVTVNVSGNSFTIQGPFGHNFTVNVNGQTEWENNDTISDLSNTSIVAISGTLDRTAATFDADSVAIVSQDSFYAGGLLTYVDPLTGTANDINLYVRDVLPSGTGFQSGAISDIPLMGTEKYFIYWMHNRFTNMFFNSGLMVPGQRVSIGGPFSNGSVTVKRIVLRNEGHTGTWVVGSTNTGASTFQFNSNGLAGVLFDGPVTVYVTPFTTFGGGLTGLSSLTGNSTIPLRVVGLVLKDPVSSQPVFVARNVTQISN